VAYAAKVQTTMRDFLAVCAGALEIVMLFKVP